jgi:hypothetical protein
MSSQFERRKKKETNIKPVYTHTTAILIQRGLNHFSLFKVNTNPLTGSAEIDLTSEKKVDGDRTRAVYELKLLLLELNQL